MTGVYLMLILIRGGGDLASGVAVRLVKSGFQVVITELVAPLTVRRAVSFAEAVEEKIVQVEGIIGKFVLQPGEVKGILNSGSIPVMIDPDLVFLDEIRPEVVVDARMKKIPPIKGKELATLVIGLGPGFSAGDNCHAVIETKRGHHLGRVIWSGPPQEDNGIPGKIGGYGAERVLRAPVDGKVQTGSQIGDRVKKGALIALVGNRAVFAPFDGILRGLIKPGSVVTKGLKIGDVDPRDDPTTWSQISDKSRAIGGGVLEAILACPDLRSSLWI
jgi:xanthine dehydrogenase accessory factor